MVLYGFYLSKLFTFLPATGLLCSHWLLMLPLVYIYYYRISSNRGPGLYFFHEILDLASKRGRHLLKHYDFLNHTLLTIHSEILIAIIIFFRRPCAWLLARGERSIFEKDSVVRGHHIYKVYWTPAIEEEIMLRTEDSNDRTWRARTTLKFSSRLHETHL